MAHSGLFNVTCISLKIHYRCCFECIFYVKDLICSKASCRNFNVIKHFYILIESLWLNRVSDQAFGFEGCMYEMPSYKL